MRQTRLIAQPVASRGTLRSAISVARRLNRALTFRETKCAAAKAGIHNCKTPIVPLPSPFSSSALMLKENSVPLAALETLAGCGQDEAGRSRASLRRADAPGHKSIHFHRHASRQVHRAPWSALA